MTTGGVGAGDVEEIRTAPGDSRRMTGCRVEEEPMLIFGAALTVCSLEDETTADGEASGVTASGETAASVVVADEGPLEETGSILSDFKSDFIGLCGAGTNNSVFFMPS
jgi:hypothetical protein